MLKNVPKYLVYLSDLELIFLLDYSFTFLLPLFILLAKKKAKLRLTFLTDSQPGYVLSMFLKFWLISA